MACYDEVVDSPPFFRPGGTMDPNAPSYVERKADRELLQALLDREYVFLLDSRQKGKSSLIARTIVMLREEGVRTIKLDLQRIGSNVTPDQWYAGLLHEIGLELGATESIFKLWASTQHLGPLARFVGVLGEAILSVADPIVIFIDEIDFVRALPFSVDEFFAAVRDCFNRRSESEVYQRLTFCLAGVATPSQLIQNPEITPFNIGRRIDLDDFTEDELLPFAQALDEAHLPGRILLSRVHYWVSGHPFLTQSLCASALEIHAKSEADIDALVSTKLLSAEQRQRDPNLADVERRMLEPFALGFDQLDARNRVLEVHRKLLKKQHVGTDQDDPSVATLLLAGVAKDEVGRLVLRNRVYEQVFNEQWRRASMPDAEVRRQRGAYRRGALRVGLIAGSVLVVVGSLTIKLALLAAERDDALKVATREADKAERAVYIRTMALMETEARDHRWIRVRELFEDVADSRYRGWEYGHWDRLLNDYDKSIQLGAPVKHFVQTADGHLVVHQENGIHVLDSNLAVLSRSRIPDCQISVTSDGRFAGVGTLYARQFRVLDIASGREIWSGDKDSNAGMSLPYLMDPDAAKLNGQLFRLEQGRPRFLGTFALPSQYLHTRVSPSGRYLLMIRIGGAVLVDRMTKKRTEFKDNFFSQTNVACFDQAETRLWVGSSADSIKELSLPSGVETRQLAGYQGGVYSLDLDAPERLLLSGSADGTVVITDLKSGQRVRTLPAHRAVAVAAWGADGNTIFTASATGEVRRYGLKKPPPVWVLPAHQGQAGRALFTSDSSRLITLSEDNTCRLYDVATRRLIRSLDVPGAPPPGYIKLSKDEKLAFVGGKEGEVVCFETATGHERWRSPELGAHLTSLTISPDESTILVGTGGGLLAQLDGFTGKVLRKRPVGEKPIRGCTFTPDGRGAVFGLWQDLHIIRTDTLATTYKRSASGAEGDIRSISLSSDGTRLLVGSTMAATEYRFQDMKALRTVTGHTLRMYGARYSPSEELICTYGMDGKARVIDRLSGRLMFEARHDSWVSAVEMTADESRLVTSSDDGTVRLWSMAMGDQVAALPGNGSTVFGVTLSKDESMLATSAQDGRVVVYFGLPRDQIKSVDRR